MDTIFEGLFERMMAADRPGANALVDEWARVHGYRRAVMELVEPALVRIGELWSGERISLAQGYMAAKIASDVMARAALEQRPQPDRPAKGPVVLGCIEDDFHALGRKLVGTFLETAGWRVCDLGNDVLASQFVDKAVEVGARVIGVSAMMATTARNIGEVRAQIDGRGLTGVVQLAVGGAVFRVRPDLVAEVGGDGTAPNALAAPALVADLWQRSEHAEATR